MKLPVLALSTLLISISSWAHPFQRLIVFGDSLSDGGTYKAATGGNAKFTINPDGNWIDFLSERLKLPISANRSEGFNKPVIEFGGLNFAQGGAAIDMDRSIGKDKGYSARSFEEQLVLFGQQKNYFTPTDLVVIEFGANDLLSLLKEVKAGESTLEGAIGEVKTAAESVLYGAALIRGNSNATTMITTLSDISKSPKIAALGEATQSLVAAMTKEFNNELIRLHENESYGPKAKIKLARLDLIDAKIKAGTYGITNDTAPACNKSLMPAGSAMFCNEQTLVSPESKETYKFSDDIHPTPKVYRIFADEIASEIEKLTNPEESRSQEEILAGFDFGSIRLVRVNRDILNPGDEYDMNSFGPSAKPYQDAKSFVEDQKPLLTELISEKVFVDRRAGEGPTIFVAKGSNKNYVVVADSGQFGILEVLQATDAILITKDTDDGRIAIIVNDKKLPVLDL
jgi:outer membrane lipase/esterase